MSEEYDDDDLCIECGSPMEIRGGQESTGFCDGCSQDKMVEFKKKLTIASEALAFIAEEKHPNKFFHIQALAQTALKQIQ